MKIHKINKKDIRIHILKIIIIIVGLIIENYANININENIFI